MIRRAIHNIRSRVFRPVIVSKPCELSVPENIEKGKKVRKSLAKPDLTKSTHRLVYNFEIGFLLFKSNMSNISETYKVKPPVSVCGMTKLDKFAFDCTVTVMSVLLPTNKLNAVGKIVKKYKLNIHKVAPIIELEKTDTNFKSHRLLLFDPEKVVSFNMFEETIRQALWDQGLTEADFKDYDLKLTYENWTFQDIVRAVVPEEFESVAAYSEIGGIAHFNLREHALPYKKLIGEALVDKNVNIRTAVNKINEIDNTYRNFQMELLSGVEQYSTQTRENGCIFELDFSKVYWNPRLATEHERIVKLMSYNDVVFDVFAGIGPFSVPIAKKDATVFANDLNPSSFESMQRNVKLNKIGDNIHCYNMDGRQFIRTIVRDQLVATYTKCGTDHVYKSNLGKIQILMNLPALAYTFLDAFKSLLPTETVIPDNVALPTVYCYCFTDQKEADRSAGGCVENEVRLRARGILDSLKDEDISVRVVRAVSTNKQMMCFSFTLTRQILYGITSAESVDHGQSQDESVGSPPRKCMKLAEESC